MDHGSKGFTQKFFPPWTMGTVKRFSLMALGPPTRPMDAGGSSLSGLAWAAESRASARYRGLEGRMGAVTMEERSLMEDGGSGRRNDWKLRRIGGTLGPRCETFFDPLPFPNQSFPLSLSLHSPSRQIRPGQKGPLALGALGCEVRIQTVTYAIEYEQQGA